MKKVLLLLALTSNIIFAQKTCDSQEESFEELNTISVAKCSIDQTKKANGNNSRQISVNISAPKKRYYKKRTIEKKEVASSINNLNTSGISQTSHSSEISNSIEIKKEGNAITNVLALTNRISKEELKNAIKFDDVSNLPQFSNCKDSNKNKQLNCFNTEMIKHIENHFDYPSEAMINKIEGNVWIRFIIDKDGNISNIKTLGPKGGKILDDEAKRVVANLPKFTPAKHKGKNVSVKYGFPIAFSLNE